MPARKIRIDEAVEAIGVPWKVELIGYYFTIKKILGLKNSVALVLNCELLFVKLITIGIELIEIMMSLSASDTLGAAPRAPVVQAPRVLTSAFLAAGKALGLPKATVYRIAGFPLLEHVGSGAIPQLNPDSTEGHRALQIIRCFQILWALTGGNPDLTKYWMRIPNKGTGGIPAVQVLSQEGLDTVLTHLETIQEREG